MLLTPSALLSPQLVPHLAVSLQDAIDSSCQDLQSRLLLLACIVVGLAEPSLVARLRLAIKTPALFTCSRRVGYSFRLGSGASAFSQNRSFPRRTKSVNIHGPISTLISALNLASSAALDRRYHPCSMSIRAPLRVSTSYIGSRRID